MKTGIESAAFRYIADANARYAHIKTLGYDTVDESIADTNQEIYRDVSAMERYCKSIREAAEKNGIEISQVHGPWPTDDKTPESREKLTAATARYLADQVEAAQ